MAILTLIGVLILVSAISTNIVLTGIVYIRNPHSATNRIFAVLGIVLSLWLVVIYSSLQPHSPDLSLFLIRLSTFFAVPMNLCFLLLADTLPSTKLRIHRWSFWILIFCTFAVMLDTISPYEFTKVSFSQSSPIPTPGIGLLPFGIYMLATTIAAIYFLFSRYMKSSGLEKQQLRFIILGFILMEGLLFITVLFPIILFKFNKLVILSPLYTLFFLLMTAYSIIRHKFLDIRPIIVRSIVYTLLLIILGLFYIAIIYLITTLIFNNSLALTQVILYALITLFVVATSPLLKTFLEKLTTNIFFKGNYSSNDLLSKLTKIMATSIELNEVTGKTLHQLLQTIHISHGTFLIFDQVGWYPLISEGLTQQSDYDREVVNAFVPLGRMIVFDEEENEQIKDVMRKINTTVVLPLIAEDKLQGLLFLGDKKSGDIYSQQDIEVLQIFAPEVSVAVQNAKSYEEIRRFNITLRDEVDKATKDLKIANDRLKELDLLKSEFVSVASHELRTPMTAIKSYLWMALEGKGGKLSEKQKYYLDRAYTSTDRLIKLVNDMLNVSRIESGRVTIDIQKVDLLKLVQDVVEEVKPRAEELGIHVKVESQELPPVLADSDKIKEVVFNLVGNSLKFTPKDGTVTVSFMKKNDLIETIVKDTGVGLEKEDLPKLFQKFGLLPGSYTTNQAATTGTGLGLFISKSIIELHEGTITADSDGRDKGAEFKFTLKVYTNEDFKRLYEKYQHDDKSQVGIIHSKI